MDNQINNSEGIWVDDRLECLGPSAEWHPDSSRALARLKKRRDLQDSEGNASWLRFSMAAAIVGVIGLVVALLPWHGLWRPASENKNTVPESVEAATPVVVPTPTPPGEPAPPVRSQPPAVPAVIAEQQNAAPAPEQGDKPAERVGPGVTAPVLISSLSEPEYTDEARKDRIQGTVVMNVIIRADGTAKVDKIIRSLGYGLDEKAVAQVEQWKFKPGTRNDKPVDVQLQITVNFHLY